MRWPNKQKRRVVSDVVLACHTFAIRERCHQYVLLLVVDNQEIEGLPTVLTKAQKNWGFGLYYLYKHNVKDFKMGPQTCALNLLQARENLTDQASQVFET